MRIKLIQWILFFELVLQLFVETEGRSVLELSVNFDPTGRKHVAQVANFGYQFRDKKFFEAILMLPPNGTHLCEFPKNLENMDRLEAPSNEAQKAPIALLVERGGCKFENKTRVALEMRDRFSERMKYVIVYDNQNTNRRGSSLILMDASREFLENNPGIESMGFAFVSQRSGMILKNSLVRIMTDSDEKYIFQTNLSDVGEFPILMERATYSWEVGNIGFYWLRFILFALLIVSPCIRAGYLWYVGGGRIITRRNSNGRIVGLQYVRPMAYWFTPGSEEQVESENSLLSEAEVDALPVTKYSKVVLKEDEQSQCSGAGTTKSMESTDDSTRDYEQGLDRKSLQSTDLLPDCEKGLGHNSVASTERTEIQHVERQSKLDNEDDVTKCMVQSISESTDEVNCGLSPKQKITDSVDNSIPDCEKGIDRNILLSTEENEIQHEEKQSKMDNENEIIKKLEPKHFESTDEVDCGHSLEQKRISVEAGAPTQDNSTHQKVIDKNEDENIATLSQISTTCTMCSICIDDFEDGEEILILPKCRHGFHTMCIKPWLTERSACCPLCKTSVDSVERENIEEPERDGIQVDNSTV